MTQLGNYWQLLLYTGRPDEDKAKVLRFYCTRALRQKTKFERFRWAFADLSGLLSIRVDRCRCLFRSLIIRQHRQRCWRDTITVPLPPNPHLFSLAFEFLITSSRSTHSSTSLCFTITQCVTFSLVVRRSVESEFIPCSGGPRLVWWDGFVLQTNLLYFILPLNCRISCRLNKHSSLSTSPRFHASLPQVALHPLCQPSTPPFGEEGRKRAVRRKFIRYRSTAFFFLLPPSTPESVARSERKNIFLVLFCARLLRSYTHTFHPRYVHNVRHK